MEIVTDVAEERRVRSRLHDLASAKDCYPGGGISQASPLACFLGTPAPFASIKLEASCSSTFSATYVPNPGSLRIAVAVHFLAL